MWSIGSGGRVSRRAECWLVVLIFGLVGACATTPRLPDIAATGDLAEVERLIEHGAAIDEREKRYGRTALHTAAKGGHVEVVEVLLARGADVNGGDGLGFTALHLAVWQGRAEVVEVLLAHGADVNANRNRRGVMPLHVAAQFGQAGMVRRLIEAGADVNARARNGETALDTARRLGRGEAVGVLEGQ
ncbi:MAG: yahDC [Gammaproteobacteria bacterium]|nr:MAG: yahDC [Gammaproteobacteria bacterium]TND04465.1 MAG: yahDC [Gammaproteobacteria bacterium]